jgi:hypothetical protein
MIARRFVLVSMLAGCVLLASGCRSLAGAGCLKVPDEKDVSELPALRVPVGLDPVDTSAVLKVPPPVAAAAAPPDGRCLEDPPKVETLVEPVDDEKAEKKRARKERSRGAIRKAPGPRLK